MTTPGRAKLPAAYASYAAGLRGESTTTKPFVNVEKNQGDQNGPAARRRRATTEAYAAYAAGRSEEATTQMAVFIARSK
jgi:ribosome modulation factor